MSMLAESKSKCKYTLNPRGLDWVNDETKFGQKLMEKMGWSKGQGLGAKNDGNVNNIHVSVKADKRGVGFSRKAAEEWLDHQDGFSNLLDQLNVEHVNPAIESSENLLSLEDKSKNSTSRLHYQKFIKSKDLSGKNSKDLNCIFGTKARNDKLKKFDEENNVIEKHSSDYGVKTSTSSLSSSDYFASKLIDLKRKRQDLISDQEFNIHSCEDPLNGKPIINNKSDNTVTYAGDILENNFSNELSIKKKKKLKKNKISINDINKIINVEESSCLEVRTISTKRIKTVKDPDLQINAASEDVLTNESINLKKSKKHLAVLEDKSFKRDKKKLKK